MRKYITSLSPKECSTILRESIDFISIGAGIEKFTGWVLLNIFSISYQSGAMRLNNPIYNKVIGILIKKNGVTQVKVLMFKGLTDLFSIAFIFIGSLLILLIATQGQLKAWDLIGLSLLCCLLAGMITFFFTWLSTEGQQGEQRLTEFIERNLELKSTE